jgi:putative oxidoreductase
MFALSLSRALDYQETMRGEPITFLLGRIFLCLIFFGSGFNKIMNFSATVEKMEEVGIPLTTVALLLAILIELVGATLIMIGWKMRYAAGALVFFVLLATIYFHNPLAYPPDQQQVQAIHLMKNLSIIGGLLLIVSQGRGPLCIERE